jgi:hypothetical protein
MTIITVNASMTTGRPPAPTVTTASADNSAVKVIHADVAGAAVGDQLLIELSSLGVSISSATVLITTTILASGYDWTTSALVDGSYSAVGRVSRLHRSGTRVYSPSSSALSILVQAGQANPSPNVADVTISLGRLTRSGVAFAQLVTTAGAITGEGGTTGLTGTNSSHFQLSATGELSTLAAFQSSPQTSYTLTATVCNAAGSDTATLTINTEAQAYDAATITQATTAVAHAKSNYPTLNSKVYLRDGVTFGDFATNMSFAGASYAFPGTVSHPNVGLTSESGYDRNAQASIVGGSCEITCRTAYSVKIKGLLSLNGASGIIVSNIVACKHYDSTPPSKTSGASISCVNITWNASNPTRPHIILRNCRIGSQWDGAGEDTSINAINIAAAASVCVEDCAINGAHIGINVGGTDYFYCLRTSCRKIIQDGMGFRGINSATIDPVIRHITDYTFYDKVEQNPFFDKLHGDAMQFGTWLDLKSTQFFAGWNYLVRPNQALYVDDCAGQWVLGESRFPTETCIYNGHLYKRIGTDSTAENAASGAAAAEPGIGANWQTYWSDVTTTAKTEVQVNGKVYRCFGMPIASAGFAAHRGSITYDRCTLVIDPFRSDAAADARFIAFRGTHTLTNSIGTAILETNGTWAQTNTQQAAKGTEATYYTGPFVSGTSSGPNVPTFDLTSATTVRASIDAAYLPKAGYTTTGHLAA